jgi:glyoxylase-like metal-dependent hydrolase (beta-lactamase superfamily II)
MKSILTGLAAASATFMISTAAAVEVQFVAVAPGVYAFIGETGGRSYDNEGLNANIGLVITERGALLIDTGASYRSARQIHEAARRVTAQPVRWAINSGGQDHRWLGNGYFRAQGIELIAHAAGRADMQGRGGDHLAALRPLLKERLDGTEPALATRWLDDDRTTLQLGGMQIEVIHAGGHTPGDVMVWLPQQRVLFAGDTIYVDRMLGVIPVSSTKRWLDAFGTVERLAPELIVPGHGRITDIATARAQTRDYLAALRKHMKRAVDDGVDLSAAIRSFDSAPFMHLANAAELHPGNASRTYLEVERE